MDRIEDRRVVNRSLTLWEGFVAVTLIAVVILLAGAHTANAYDSAQSTSLDGGSGILANPQALGHFRDRPELRS